MKASLIHLINKTVQLNYKLPNVSLGIDKSFITADVIGDDCFTVLNLDDFSRIVYESILYYSYDDFQLDGGNHGNMFLAAFNTKFKYNYGASDLAKRKLGIYGEALLYAVLKQFYNTDVLVSRGYFYDYQKKSEVTGYDAFHLVQNNNQLELWFGETKFTEGYKSAIDSVFKNIQKAISDNYLKINLLTILQHKGEILDKTSPLYKVLEQWEKGQISSIENELKNNNIKLIYPVLVTFNVTTIGYDQIVKDSIKYVNDKYGHLKFDNLTIDFSLFFIIVPIDDVKTVKEKVIQWIDQKEPLML